MSITPHTIDIMVRCHQAEPLRKLKWWDMPEEKLKEHIALFQKENVTVEELVKQMISDE